jgi:hypothetical protein
MAPRQHMSQTDTVRMYIEMIQGEKQKIEDALEAIRDYAEKLAAASGEAQQRLIGRS